MKIIKRSILFSILILALVITGCSSESPVSSKEDGSASNSSTDSSETAGGELNIAVAAQPPSLDPHITTAVQALQIARNMFETLVTIDEDYQTVPMLAEAIESSDDGKTYTFHLREGVKFHNGEEMTSDDVVASMNRWLEKASVANTFLSGSTFEAQDKYTVVMKLKNRANDALDIMAGRSQFPAIMPKEVIEAAGKEGVSEIIGTGPFKFEEWKQDQFIHLTKFEDYQMSDEEPSGLAGKKEVFVDDVYFHVVEDPLTRLAGIETGEYDIATLLPNDSYEKLKNMSNAEIYLDYEGTENIYYNRKEGIMADAKMRQAVNAALNMDEIMLAAYTHEDLYELYHGYMKSDQEKWASEAGEEAYNQANLEKAKNMLEEAGYDGEEIILLTSRTYEGQYNGAIVVKEQLEQIGMKVNLEDYDWTTYQDRRSDPTTWDLVTVGGQGLITSPSQLLALDSNFASGTNDPTVTELMNAMRTAGSEEEAKKYWDELQGYLWNEYVPISIYGHFNSITATTDKVEGFSMLQGPILWNTKKLAP